MALSTGQAVEPEETPEKNYAHEFARKSGLVDGKARAEALSPAKRKKIAKAAAEARWGKSAKKEVLKKINLEERKIVFCSLAVLCVARLTSAFFRRNRQLCFCLSLSNLQF